MVGIPNCRIEPKWRMSYVLHRGR